MLLISSSKRKVSFLATWISGLWPGDCVLCGDPEGVALFEVVSTDFYSSPFASIIDSQATIASGKRITLYCWYDNEYGYSKQVTNLAKKIAGVNLTRLPKPIEKNI